LRKREKKSLLENFSKLKLIILNFVYFDLIKSKRIQFKIRKRFFFSNLFRLYIISVKIKKIKMRHRRIVSESQANKGHPLLRN
jgi:hypothetical protein